MPIPSSVNINGIKAIDVYADANKVTNEGDVFFKLSNYSSLAESIKINTENIITTNKVAENTKNVVNLVVARNNISYTRRDISNDTIINTTQFWAQKYNNREPIIVSKITYNASSIF